VNKANFKVGSLDQLMEMMDTFQKYESGVAASCARAEKTFFDIAEEINEPKNARELRIEVGNRSGDYYK